MIYAKIKSRTQLEYAPKEIKHSGRRIINPSAEILTELGFMPVVHTEMPVEDGYYFTAYYEVEGEQIVQKWERHEFEPQPSIEDEVAQIKQTQADIMDALIELADIIGGEANG